MRSPSEWQHPLGPPAAPVVIAGASNGIRRLVDAIRALGAAEAARCVIVEGGGGSGKSLAAGAFQAACDESGINAVVVNEGTEPGSVMRRFSAAEALIVDNLDRLGPGLRRALFERRHSVTGGVLLTLSRIGPIERQILGADDDHHPMGRWEDRPTDVLIIASLAWDEMGLSPGLAELCTDDVAEALVRGPWLRGAHSIRRAVSLLEEGLELAGYFERAPRRIAAVEVLEAVVAMIREERSPEHEDEIRIVVEGSTDGVYLRTAARLAQGRWDCDLLAGCRVAPPGEDREGGAEKAVRELFLLDAQGIPAVALFDDDEPGRSAAKDARKFSGQKVHVLPAEFDPLQNQLGRGRTEIEDLVSISLLERFYAEHHELEPEERTTRGSLTRLVVAGPDKDVAANWISDHASFSDVEKIVYVICTLRQSLGLPLPDTCPTLPEWLRTLSQ